MSYAKDEKETLHALSLSISRPKARPSGASATWREIGDRRRGYARPAGTAATSRYRGGSGPTARRFKQEDCHRWPRCRNPRRNIGSVRALLSYHHSRHAVERSGVVAPT